MGHSWVELQTARILSFLSLPPAGDLWWARVSVTVVGLPDSGMLSKRFLVISYGVVDLACLAERQLDIRPALSPAMCLQRVSYLAVRSLYMRFRFNGCNGYGGVDWRRQSSERFFRTTAS
ncbi:unnamed protein product, partial [Brassica oleracea]